MHRARIPALLLVLLLLAACGGSPSASEGGGDDGGNGGNGGNGEASQPAESEPAGGNGGNGGNGGGGSGDVEQLADDLTPPNSTEISRTTAEGGIWVTYESTDSAESLAGFYESAIDATGLTIYSTTTVQGTYAWLFAEDDTGSGFGGSVTVAAMDDGGGSTVVVLVAPGG